MNMEFEFDFLALLNELKDNEIEMSINSVNWYTKSIDVSLHHDDLHMRYMIDLYNYEHELGNPNSILYSNIAGMIAEMKNAIVNRIKGQPNSEFVHCDRCGGRIYYHNRDLNNRSDIYKCDKCGVTIPGWAVSPTFGRYFDKSSGRTYLVELNQKTEEVSK